MAAKKLTTAPIVKFDGMRKGGDNGNGRGSFQELSDRLVKVCSATTTHLAPSWT